MKRIIILIVLLIPLFALAQPGGDDPPIGDPDVPIAGIEWLIVTGGIFGARKLYRKFKNIK